MKLQDVMKAADAMVAEGLNPTLKDIRDRLGGGSYSDIGPYLKVWRANCGTPPDDAPLPPPETLSKAVALVVEEAWNSARQIAHSAYEANRKALEAERTALRSGELELSALADSLASQVDELTRDNVRLEVALAETRRQVDEAVGRAKQLRDLLDSRSAASGRTKRKEQ